MLTLTDVEQSIRDTQELFSLAKDEGDEQTLHAIDEDSQAIQAQVEGLEFRRMFSNAMDANNCFMEFQSGSGGTEAQDWASMLLRMYLRYCERKGFQVEVMEESDGEVAGIKSASLKISGEYAYGFLRTESGVHRLVRKSPFDSGNRRHTSFASVQVFPEVDDSIEIDINPADLRIDTYRASGAGGQHVNKTSSAVRITHIPSGIVVQCQNERSQLQNKELAMHMLRGKLAEMKARQEEAKLAAIRGTQLNIEWGSQIRSYVFQPYTLVKDVRTKASVGDVQKVMDGYLEPFMTAYLRYIAGKGTSGDDSNDDMDA